jgi:hypothetical protein
VSLAILHYINPIGDAIVSIASVFIDTFLMEERLAEIRANHQSETAKSNRLRCEIRLLEHRVTWSRRSWGRLLGDRLLEDRLLERLAAELKTEEIKRDFHLEPLEDVIPTGDEKKEGELPTFTSYDLLIGLTMSLVTGCILYFLFGE